MPKICALLITFGGADGNRFDFTIAAPYSKALADRFGKGIRLAQFEVEARDVDKLPNFVGAEQWDDRIKALVKPNRQLNTLKRILSGRYANKLKKKTASKPGPKRRGKIRA